MTENLKDLQDENQRLRAALSGTVPFLDRDKDLSDQHIFEHCAPGIANRRRMLRHAQAVLALDPVQVDVANLPHAQPTPERDKEIAEQFSAMVTALAFARSVIKSGEPWTSTCEEVIERALSLAQDNAALLADDDKGQWIDDLAKRLPHARPEFVAEVKMMGRRELQRRALIGSDWQGAFACSLDGIKEINCIPGGGIDGCRDHDGVRRIVLTIIAACHFTWEDNPGGRIKKTANTPKSNPLPVGIWLQFRPDGSRGIIGLWDFEPWKPDQGEALGEIVEFRRVMREDEVPQVTPEEMAAMTMFERDSINLEWLKMLGFLPRCSHRNPLPGVIPGPSASGKTPFHQCLLPTGHRGEHRLSPLPHPAYLPQPEKP